MPVFRKYFLLLVLATSPMALAADRDRVNQLGQNFICVCGGCNQVLMQCNHLGCPSREAMMRDLDKKVGEGLSDASVIDYFVAKYGETVLSAPPASGFNLTAWITPFAMLLLGGVALASAIRRLRSRWIVQAVPIAIVSEYAEKVEDELRRLSPTD